MKSSKQSARPKTPATASGESNPSAVVLLKQDHRRVTALFRQFRNAPQEQKAALAKEICKELVVHTLLEEEIFYPACREAKVEDKSLNEAQVEHDGAKVLIGELMQQPPESPFFDAKVTVLSEYIKHHVGEEEKPEDGIFAKARAAQIDLKGLGQRLQARKQELMAQVEAQGLPPPAPRSFASESINSTSKQEKSGMARQDERDRDEQGRFTSDDDNGRGGYSGRGGNGGGGGGRGNDRDRDDQGRFASDDDDRSGGGRSSGGQGRGGNQGRGQGQGGWFGDSEGHSRASQEGWENRGRSGGGGGRGNDRDDDQYQSRGRGGSRSESYDDDRGGRGGRGGSQGGRDDDDRSSGGRSGGGRNQGGWFGDSEGHSRAAQEGWENRGGGGGGGRGRDDDDDRSSGGRGGGGGGGGRSGGGGGGGRGQGGWFGDPEGHSRASQEGWENRGGGGGGGGGGRGRGRDDDDDRSSGGRGSGGGGGGGRGGQGNQGGQNHGGWFGDSRGHAEAARRGWQNRD